MSGAMVTDGGRIERRLGTRMASPAAARAATMLTARVAAGLAASA